MPPKRSTAEEMAEFIFQLIRSDDFLSIKELEKLGPNGAFLIVKEIAGSLVDDGRVEREKIGSANYYWSFASQTSHVVRNAHDKSAVSRSEAETKLKVVENLLLTAKNHRKPSAQRQEQLQALLQIEKEIASLTLELDRINILDPATIKHRLDLLEMTRSSAIAHTGNLAILIKFAQQWLQVEPQRAFLNLSSEWEELEELPAILTDA